MTGSQFLWFRPQGVAQLGLLALKGLHSRCWLGLKVDLLPSSLRWLMAGFISSRPVELMIASSLAECGQQGRLYKAAQNS